MLLLAHGQGRRDVRGGLEDEREARRERGGRREGRKGAVVHDQRDARDVGGAEAHVPDNSRTRSDSEATCRTTSPCYATRSSLAQGVPSEFASALHAPITPNPPEVEIARFSAHPCRILIVFGAFFTDFARFQRI